ncbi:hypothetical protein RZS08_29255, partial [Arthrospira platensis SPKY1]|nr:hypothetical protein [Arthrospira platensis SPKY1]
PGLSDVECIGIEMNDKWNAETVKDALQRVFAQAGKPAAIIKDGGTDLAKGVKLWAEENGSVPEIRDIGHVVANELKRHYTRNNVLARFLSLVDKAKHRLCQTNLACIRPPKIRSKGRFQSISKLVG